MIKTLLLNYNYQIISFISEKKAIKLLVKEKAEVVSVWQNRKIYSPGCSLKYPATLRMKYMVYPRPTKLTFSRKLILRRDNYCCCFCGMKLKKNLLTIDHIIPKSLGGENSFMNCITACLSCNYKKANRTPEQANMRLLKKPFVPTSFLCYLPIEIEWHPDWLFFVGD